MKEFWKDISDRIADKVNPYWHIESDVYQVSNLGNIRNKNTGNVLGVGKRFVTLSAWKVGRGHEEHMSRCLFSKSHILYAAWCGKDSFNKKF